MFKEKKEMELEEFRKILGEETPVELFERPSSFEEIECRRVFERGAYTYMADLVTDETGHLVKVCFDRVKYN